jgi:tRNA modification GTPase
MQLEEALRRCGRWTGASLQPRVAIAGAPNVGKSSLLNALSGLDRAIISALAGTTRDVLSAPAKLAQGLEVLLLDAAGLDGSTDPLAQSAQAAARAAVASSEAVLLVADLTGELSAQAELLDELRALNSRARPVLAANKIDLAGDPAAALAELSRRLGLEALPVSALTGAGLGRLRAALANCLEALASPRQSGLLLHENQRSNLQRAAAAARAGAGLLCGAAELADRAELVALELRSALDQLAELAGQLANEELLGEIFRRFCVGK